VFCFYQLLHSSLYFDLGACWITVYNTSWNLNNQAPIETASVKSVATGDMMFFTVEKRIDSVTTMTTHQPTTWFNRVTFTTSIHARLTDLLVDMSTIPIVYGVNALNVSAFPMNVNILRRMWTLIYSTVTPSHSSSCNLRSVGHILHIHLRHIVLSFLNTELLHIVCALQGKLRQIVVIHHSPKCYKVAGFCKHQCE